MSWPDIKSTPRIELEGLMQAYNEYTTIHNFDGYTSEDVSEMAKNKPEIRSKYGEYILANRKLRENNLEELFADADKERA